MRALVLLSLIGTPAFAAGDITGDPAMFTTLDAGIICKEGDRRREAAPDTRSGYIEVLEGPSRLGLSARRIPAVPGLGFGVVARMSETEEALGVTLVVTHPPMGAEGTVRESWQSDFLPGESIVNFFSFDLPEERVTGPWTMEALYQGRVLYTARFEVVDPAAMPDFVSPCREPPPIS